MSAEPKGRLGGCSGLAEPGELPGEYNLDTAHAALKKCSK